MDCGATSSLCLSVSGGLRGDEFHRRALHGLGDRFRVAEVGSSALSNRSARISPASIVHRDLAIAVGSSGDGRQRRPPSRPGTAAYSRAVLRPGRATTSAAARSRRADQGRQRGTHSLALPPLGEYGTFVALSPRSSVRHAAQRGSSVNRSRGIIRRRGREAWIQSRHRLHPRSNRSAAR